MAANDKMPSEILDRLPPHNLDAERGVIGSAILDPRTLDVTGSIVAPDDFLANAHRKLFGHLLLMRDAGEPFDPVVLVDRLRAAGDLEAVGGVAAIGELAQAVPVAAHAEHYARLVAASAARRGLIHALCEALKDAYDPQDTVEAIVERVERVVSRIETGDYRGTPVPIAVALREAIARADAIVERGQCFGVPTGFCDFDYKLGGLFGGELSILAARPGVGKTALACQIALNVAERGRRVYFASLEMSAVELTTRLLCSQAGVDSRLIRTGRLTGEQVGPLTKTSAALATADVLLHDRPGMTVGDIRRAVRRVHDCGLVVVDYLQRITPPDKRVKRYEQVAEIAKQLKTLARERDVPVLCLAQLNRTVEGEPQMHHLRESGDIEAEADVVGLLWRPAAWTEDQARAAKNGTDPPAGQATWKIAKNRNGPLARFRLDWEAERTRFVAPDTAKELF